MEQSKAEILGELYAIRATMSVVAQNEGETQKQENSISEFCNATDRYVKDREKRVYDLRWDTRKRNLEQKRSRSSDDLKRHQEIMKSVDESSSAEESENYFYPIFLFVLVTVICGGILSGILFAILSSTMENLNDSVLFIVIGEILCCGLGAIPGYLASRNAFRKTKENRTHRKSLQGTVQTLEDQILECESKMQGGETYIDAEAVARYIKESQKRKEETTRHTADCRSVIQSLKEDSRALVNAAVEAYPVIDFRDWGNVDLLIYYFETGRADTVKEALQLVDRQLQTDQMVRAIEMASQELQRTIQDSVYRLGKTMVECFDRLSDQLEAQHHEAMLSETMTNAMLAQIATKSTDLYVQVH